MKIKDTALLDKEPILIKNLKKNDFKQMQHTTNSIKNDHTSAKKDARYSSNKGKHRDRVKRRKLI